MEDLGIDSIRVSTASRLDKAKLYKFQKIQSISLKKICQRNKRLRQTVYEWAFILHNAQSKDSNENVF